MGRAAGGRDLLDDIPAGAEARVNHAKRREGFQRSKMRRRPLRLADDRPIPVEAEPDQVFEDAGFEFGPGAPLIQIFDPEQEAAVL